LGRMPRSRRNFRRGDFFPSISDRISWRVEQFANPLVVGRVRRSLRSGDSACLDPTPKYIMESSVSLGNFTPGLSMIIPRHHLRLSHIALAAIVGMLSMVGEASARMPGGLSDSAKSCCIVPMPSDCCCCPAKANSLAASAGRSTEIANGETRLAAPAGSCECRSNEPAAPASKPESRSPDRRTERVSEGAVDTSFFVRPPVTSSRFIPPTDGPPNSPLHLITIRLQI
jgi:hypothetical protein